jgi:hypothetical protein
MLIKKGIYEYCFNISCGYPIKYNIVQGAREGVKNKKINLIGIFQLGWVGGSPEG